MFGPFLLGYSWSPRVEPISERINLAKRGGRLRPNGTAGPLPENAPWGPFFGPLYRVQNGLSSVFLALFPGCALVPGGKNPLGLGSGGSYAWKRFPGLKPMVVRHRWVWKAPRRQVLESVGTWELVHLAGSRIFLTPGAPGPIFLWNACGGVSSGYKV